MIESGTALGPYVVLGQLGSGGMGDVYRAHDSRLDRDVALKLLPPEFAREPERLARFRQEALHLAALNHPNIATIHGFEDGDPARMFLVLELVEGESLAARIERGALPPEEALAVAAQIAEALEAAHERGVIHRDLKPANVMLGPRGRVKVLDFGLARGRRAGGGARAVERAGGHLDLDALMQSPDGATLAPIAPATMAGDPGATIIGGGVGATLAGDADEGSRGGAIEGTPGYMSPEQIAAGAQDARTDVFAFGAVLYEALAGTPAFPGATVGELLRTTLERPPAWDRLPGKLSPRIRALLEQALEKSMAKRPASVHEMRLEIEDVLGIRRAQALRAGEALAVAHNLPQLLTSFVGRDDELAATTRLLGETRMLTLTGFGGSGKTRLAIELATRALAEHPDGAWFVDLAPVRDASRIEAALAGALSVREEPGRSLTEALLDRLRGRRALVLLDNCEHLLAPCAALATILLRASPELRILATSREALGVEGESVHAVPTMSLPAAELAGGASVFEKYESVRLYVERARLVAPDFALSDANAATVGEICRRLDGIPLALELAAARARVLGVEQILAKLDDRFRLLTGGSRTALPRQQTLRATIEWSYGMLAEREQEFLRRLAVFAGGWSLEGATAVVEENGDEFEMLDLLTLLVDKSLAVVDRSGATDGARYRFLESVRQFALERLRETDEEPALRERHLAHFLALAETAEGELMGPRQGEWFARLDADGENLLAALTASRTLPGGPARGLRLAGSVARFWSARGRYVLGLRALTSALEVEARARAEAGGAPPDANRGKALVRAGGLALYLYDLAAAAPPIEESLAIYQALGDRKGVARAHSALATLAALKGEFAESRRAGLTALELYRANGDDRGVAVTLHNLGYLALRQRDWLQASPSYEEAMSILRRVGDREHMALTLADLAVASEGLGRSERASAELVEALTLVAELSARREGAFALEAAAALAEAWGDPARAVRYAGAAQATREAIGSPLSPLERGERDARLERLEKLLGGLAYGTAYEAGQGQALDAAVADARAWLDAKNGLASQPDGRA